LAHANGFPPATYRPLAATLFDHFQVIALSARPLWPGSRPESVPNWHTLADDLIGGLDELGLKGIVGVGHSLGGVNTMFAAVRRPQLFRAVVLIDPVILPPSWLRLLRLMRWLGLGQRQPLVQGALRRRRTWPSRQACYNHFRGKPLFANWPDASLRAYVEGGTRPRTDEGVELVYPPEWEAHIFATPPLDVWRFVPRLRTRTLVIKGEHSDTFQPSSERRMARRLPDAFFHIVPKAGHLLPMERPIEIGSAIREFIRKCPAGA
jgi:pimeloyl-ACP methyl ester carboxylesterase